MPTDFHNALEAHKWANEALAKRPGRLQMFQCFVSELNQLQIPPRTVLELGSGPGFLAEQILSRCPSVETYYLLDFSGVMHILGRSRLGSFAEKTQFIHADFSNGSWLGAVPVAPDVVVIMESANEVRKRNVPRLYAEIASILLPQGTLLVCDYLPSHQVKEERLLYMEPHEQMNALAAAGFHERGVRASQAGLALYRAQFGQVREEDKIGIIDEKPCQTVPDACK